MILWMQFNSSMTQADHIHNMAKLTGGKDVPKLKTHYAHQKEHTATEAA